MEKENEKKKNRKPNDKQVKIYKLSTFDCFTDVENNISNDKYEQVKDKKTGKVKTQKKKQKDINKEIETAILENSDDTESRRINSKRLTEDKQICIFESDIVRLAVKDRGEIEIDRQLIDEIIYLEIGSKSKSHLEILRQIINNGLFIDDIKYIFFTATAGQTRSYEVTLIKESFYNKHESFLMVGLTKEKINNYKHKNGTQGINVGKFLAYLALNLSSSIIPEMEIDIDRCIVVPGLETSVRDKVKYLDIKQDADGKRYIPENPFSEKIMDVIIEHSDGAGMYLPDKTHKAKNSSFQIRGGWMKGCVFPFDFKDFCLKVAKKTKITDVWGKEHDIIDDDVRYIFTASQFKMNAFYTSWDEYKTYFKEFGNKLTINNYSHNPKPNAIVKGAYQFFQTLPPHCDIKKLCDPTKEHIIKLHDDSDYVISELGLKYKNPELIIDIENELDEETLINNNADTEDVADTTEETESDKGEEKEIENNINERLFIAEALSIYPQLLYDEYVIKKIKTFVKAERRKAMGGKIQLDGFYSYVCPDLFALSQHLFMNEKTPKGLVEAGCVYNKYSSYDEIIQNVSCLRSPHLTRYEHVKRKLLRSKEANYWFKYLLSETVVSSHDLISKSLMNDWDGDEILISPNIELYNLGEELPPLYYEMAKAPPQLIDNDSIHKTLEDGFTNNNIGIISNSITKLCNLPVTKDDPYPYDELISVLCAYGNYSIDYAKTGVNINDLGEYKDMYKDLIKFPKPIYKNANFFIEAKNKKRECCEKINGSPMNRIKKYVGTGTGRLDYSYFDKDKKGKSRKNKTKKENPFNFEMLKYQDKNYNRLKYKYHDKYTALKDLLVTLKYEKSQMGRKSNKKSEIQNIDKRSYKAKSDAFHHNCICKIMDIFKNEKGDYDMNLAINFFIDLEYCQDIFKTKSKSILWECFGDILVENLYTNIKSEKEYKPRSRMDYKKLKINFENYNESKIILADNSIEKYWSSVDITKNDIDFINKTVDLNKKQSTVKRIKPFKNDFAIIYVLLCLFKNSHNKRWLDKDGYMRVAKGKHKNKFYNFYNIVNLAKVSTHIGTINKFIKNNNVDIKDSKDGKYCLIKFNIAEFDNSKTQFVVENINIPMVYLDYWKNKNPNKKPLENCLICWNHYPKEKNNETCSDECSIKLKVKQKQDKEWNEHINKLEFVS